MSNVEDFKAEITPQEKAQAKACVAEFENSMPDWQLKQIHEIYGVPSTPKESIQPRPEQRSRQRDEIENGNNKYQYNRNDTAAALALSAEASGILPRKSEADLRRDSCHRAFFDKSLLFNDAYNADKRIEEIPLKVWQAKADNKNSVELGTVRSMMRYPNSYEANRNPDNHLTKHEKSIYDSAKSLGLKPTIEMHNRMEDDATGRQRWVIVGNW